MKTIKPGTRPPKFKWVGVWECPYCKGVYELEEDDESTVQAIYHDSQMDGPSVEVYCVTCEQRRYWYPEKKLYGGVMTR